MKHDKLTHTLFLAAFYLCFKKLVVLQFIVYHGLRISTILQAKFASFFGPGISAEVG